ncbi:MAG TPA: Ig-like domain-containing protein [Gemmataceae bacterium]
MLETRTTPAVIYGGVVSTLTLGLAAASDTGVAGNSVTEAGTVTLTGHGPANTRITLTRPGAASLTTTSGPQGNFAFTGVNLPAGANIFTVTATNSAGQRLQTQKNIIRNTAPTVAAPQADISVAPGAADTKLNLPTIFSDVDVNSLVSFTTNRGTFQIELFDQQVGTTVANFLKYVTGTTTNHGSYANTIFHRKTTLVPDGIAVLQGGGFQFKTDASGGHLDDSTHIPPDAAIALQTGVLTNALGTIAMARTSVANSATSEFFFNTADNSKALDKGGTADPNGYAVFGVVRGSGMDTVNQSWNVPAQAHGQFASIPLDNYTGTNFPTDATAANFETLLSTSVVRRTSPNDPDKLTFAASSSNSGLVTAAVSGGQLILHYVTGQTGTSNITVTATDANGAKISTTFKVTVATQDTTAPAVTVTSPADGQTFTTNPTITGSATDNVGVTKLQASVDGGAPQDVAVDSQGHYAFTPTLATDGSADGRHTVAFTAKDAAGNTSAPANISFFLQVHAPVVTISAPPNNQTFRIDPTIVGQTAAGVTQLQAAVDGGAAQAVTVDGQGNFSFTPTLATDGSADGSHTVTFTAGAGQFDAVTFTFHLDATAPAVTVTSPATGQTFTASPTVTGHATDAGGVASLQATVDGGAAQAVTVNAQGDFSFNPSVTTDGSHTVTFIATDTAGNQSAPTALTFTLDATAPTIDVTDPPGNSLSNTNRTFTGVAADNVGLSQVTVSVDGGAAQAVTVDAQGNFSFTSTLATDGTADGVHSLTFVARDGAGTTASVTRVFILDVTPPVATLVGPADGQTVSTNPTITFAATDNIGTAAGDVYIDGVYKQTVSFPLNGSFTFTPDLPTDGSADGAHTVTFVANDAALNRSAPVDFHFTLQTQQGP